MPKKYHVHVEDTPWRFPPISKYSSIELEGCLGCLQCVKRNSCIYDIYDKKGFDPRQIMDTGDSMCLNCFRCVQECKKGILTRARNPRYDELGDDYWRPDIIANIWEQAATGKIPVSGAGYRGPFSGPGFDRMWTDMSEIVRPTRDGIHGREYISTVIELGRRPESLEFDKRGKLTSALPQILEIPTPVILDIPPFGFVGESTRRAIVEAAGKLSTLAVATAEEANGPLASHKGHLIVKYDPSKDDESALKGAPVIELAWSEDVLERQKTLKSSHPDSIISIRLPLDENAAERAAILARNGAEVVHLQADFRGNGKGAKSGQFIVDLVREVHLKMVDESLRDKVTLFITGGVALAEHVAKIIICGVDGVGVDMPLLAALECRLCAECERMAACPAEIDNVPVDWAAQRIVNLLGSWHSQLIEVLGAMGLREVRRLRGEVGRAMFFEDLEKESFAPIFGERIAP